MQSQHLKVEKTRDGRFEASLRYGGEDLSQRQKNNLVWKLPLAP